MNDNSPYTPPFTPPPSPLPVCCDGSQQVWHEEPSSNYKKLRDLGEGSFGNVTECLKLDTGDIVAVKFPKPNSNPDKDEVSMLKRLRCLDPDKCHIVNFYDSFLSAGQTCLVFEILDISVYDYIKQRSFKTLQLKDIRSIVQQVTTALEALKTIGVIHTDVKLDNIMLVDHVKKPFSVKLIDFGCAVVRSEAKPGDRVQPLHNRSPEIILGLPYSEAIDMWALGCMMSQMFCDSLFRGRREYDVMRHIVHLLGQPAEHLLTAGLKTKNFFFSHQGWRLKTPEEYAHKTGILPEVNMCYRFSSLDELTEFNLDKENGAEVEDRRQFVHLLKQMLQMDARHRITPSEVLAHPFISHLSNGSHHSSHSEAPPPAITSEPVDGSRSQAQSRSKGTKVDPCAMRTFTKAQPRIILVQPYAGQDSNCSRISSQISSSQVTPSELAVISEGTPLLDTTEVGAPTARPAVDSGIVASTLVPLNSPAAGPAIAGNQAVVVNTDSAHSTSEDSKPKKKKKKGVRHFFSRLLRALCCCGATKVHAE